jgi:hypothetical protein
MSLTKINVYPKYEEASRMGGLCFLLGTATASLLGTAAIKSVFAETATQQGWTPDNASLPQGIRDDIERRLKLTEELPKPAGLRPNAQLDGRFPVSYKTSVPEAMKYLTEYFAAFSSRDLAGVASTLHFPYATYEGVEPIVYQSVQEFINNPPPSLNVTQQEYKKLTPPPSA